MRQGLLPGVMSPEDVILAFVRENGRRGGVANTEAQRAARSRNVRAAWVGRNERWARLRAEKEKGKGSRR